jgi:hypothetical protein
MSNFVEIHGDPDYIRNRGAMLAAAGQSFDAKAKGLVSQISGYEAGAPWGGDDYGSQFLVNDQGGYHSTKNLDKPFNEYVKTSSSSMGQKLTHTGEAIQNAMIGYQFADLDNAADIENA